MQLLDIRDMWSLLSTESVKNKDQEVVVACKVEVLHCDVWTKLADTFLPFLPLNRHTELTFPDLSSKEVDMSILVQ